MGSANSISRKAAEPKHKEPQQSPPTFIKGISSHLKDTKYSNAAFISDNTGYELQEVKEHTIYEEENEQASAVW